MALSRQSVCRPIILPGSFPHWPNPLLLSIGHEAAANMHSWFKSKGKIKLCPSAVLRTVGEIPQTAGADNGQSCFPKEVLSTGTRGKN